MHVFIVPDHPGKILAQVLVCMSPQLTKPKAGLKVQVHLGKTDTNCITVNDR